MIIKNISGSGRFFGWIGKNGAWLDNNENSPELSDEVAFLPEFKAARDAGAIEVVSYDDSPESHVVQEELSDILVNLDGDKLHIDWVPSNYAPDNSIPEADTVEQLAAHLKGIDTTLGSIGGGVTDIVKNTTKTVGPSGKDYTTISAALGFFGQKFCINCAIEVDPGVYSGVDIDRILGDLTIRATSTRNYLCGCSWGHGITIRHGKGSGVASLSSSGNTITVSTTGSPPDFSDLQSGDIILVRDSSLTRYDLTVSSGDASGNIVCTTAPPAGVNAEGASLTIYPLVEMGTTKLNDSYEWYTRIFFNGVKFSGGFSATSQSNLSKAENCMFNGIGVIESSYADLANNCTFYNNGPSIKENSTAFFESVFFIHWANAPFVVAEDDAFIDLYRAAIVAPNRPITADQGSIVHLRQAEYFARYSPAMEARGGGHIYGQDMTLKDVASCQIGAFANNNGSMKLEGATIDGFSDGIRAWDGGMVNCYNATIINCTSNGIYANRYSYVNAPGTSSKMSGNGADYNPPTSLVPGNGESVIYWT